MGGPDGLRGAIGRSFAEHPASVGETYREHLIAACVFAARLLGSGLACLVHAFVPAVYPHTASDTVTVLHRELRARRQQPRAALRQERR